MRTSVDVNKPTPWSGSDALRPTLKQVESGGDGDVKPIYEEADSEARYIKEFDVQNRFYCGNGRIGA